MNSSIIWIFIPVLMGWLLFVLRRWHRLSILLGTLSALALAGLAFILPLGQQIRLGPLSFRILEIFEVLGRVFLLADKDRFLLGISYMMVAFWFGGSYLSGAGKVMVPFGYIFVSILIAAFAVKPFLYGAILLEIGVIVSIPIIVQSSLNFRNDLLTKHSQPDLQYDENLSSRLVRGSLRFLIFQSLGMPFLLITGWVLAGVETTPGETVILMTAGLIGLGFMLILALFPFHTWVVMLTEIAQPYVITFVIVIFTWFVTLFGIRFMDQYAWLRQEVILDYLRTISIIVLIIPALSVVFEQNLGRMLGYALLMETAYILLAVSLENGLLMVFQMLLPRILSFATWSLSLGLIKKSTGTLNIKSLIGLIRFMPVTGITLVLAQMSIAGLPLLAAFPVRYALWEQLSKYSIWLGLMSMVGFLGLLLASMRVLASMIGKNEKPAYEKVESRSVYLILGAAILIILVIGIFPNLFFPFYQKALVTFTNLVPAP